MLLVVLFGGEIGGETEVGRYPPPLTLLEEEELLIAILDRWLAMGASWCLRRRCLFRICYCVGRLLSVVVLLCFFFVCCVWVLKRVQHILRTQIFSQCALLDEYCSFLSYLNLSNLYSIGTLISEKHIHIKDLEEDKFRRK